MNAYFVYCYGLYSNDSQNPGWYHEVKVFKGIKIEGHNPDQGLCFLRGRGSILIDNKSHRRNILRADISKIPTDKFHTRHIAKQESRKVLHVLRQGEEKSKDVLVHIIFDGELYIPYKRVLDMLHVSEDQIVSCESSFFNNGEQYVFSMVFVLKAKESTSVLFGKRAICNHDGKLEN